MLAVQCRAALRVSALIAQFLMVVAGVIPLDLLAFERQTIFCPVPQVGKKTSIGRLENRNPASLATEMGVGLRWSLDFCLISYLCIWIDCGHEEIDINCISSLQGMATLESISKEWGKSDIFGVLIYW